MIKVHTLNDNRGTIHIEIDKNTFSFIGYISPKGRIYRMYEVYPHTRKIYVSSIGGFIYSELPLNILRRNIISLFQDLKQCGYETTIDINDTGHIEMSAIIDDIEYTARF